MTKHFQIMRKITLMQSTNKLSKNSIRLQKQLFQTLIIQVRIEIRHFNQKSSSYVFWFQTCIPIIGSFLPTVISWYAPIFGVNMEWWNMNVATVAMAAFPFIDPLAVIYLIPSYRNAILRKRGNIVDDSSHVKTRQSSRMQSYAFSS